MIIYSDQAVPAYSHKFNPDFHISDDFLLSAFLTSLRLYASHGEQGTRPTEMELDGKAITVQYSEELGLAMIELNKTLLLFYEAKKVGLTIGVGIKENKKFLINRLFEVSQMMVELEGYMTKFASVDWKSVDQDILDEIDYYILFEVVHKYVEAHTSDDDCYLGEDCPFKFEEEPTPTGNNIEKKGIRSRFRRGKK